MLGAYILAGGSGAEEPTTPLLRTLFIEDLKRERGGVKVEFLFHSVSVFCFLIIGI